MNTDQDFATHYLERTTSASKEQGIDDLVDALEKQGIKATSEQTGGFTMCAYIELKDDKYIYANTYGAGVYNEEGHEQDLYYNDDDEDDNEEDQKARIKRVVQVVAEWIKNNQQTETPFGVSGCIAPPDEVSNERKARNERYKRGNLR